MEINKDFKFEDDDCVQPANSKSAIEQILEYERIEESSEDTESQESLSSVESDITDELSSVASVEVDMSYFVKEPESVVQESFDTMNLSRPILSGLATLGIVKPTKIQNEAIPILLKGKDISACAETGSGKTLAYLLPIFERLIYKPSQKKTRVLILVPTRELAKQVYDVSQNFLNKNITACLCIGGMAVQQQQLELKNSPDLVIATPGRILDHAFNSKGFDLGSIEILVLDEADRMLSDGFKEELDQILKFTPRNRQTLLFSATMTDDVNELVRVGLDKPARVFVSSPKQAATNLLQEFVRVKSGREFEKIGYLISLCKRIYKEKVIIFFRTKHEAHRMFVVFNLLNMKALELHGGLNQALRTSNLKRFKNDEASFLLCSDLAARGIDIEDVKTVINYDMPNNLESYLHRCGRTARNGKKGTSCSLVLEQDRKLLKMIVKYEKESKLRQRTVNSESIKEYVDTVRGLDVKIRELLEKEKELKIIDKTEMEINKTENMIKFKDEIMSRPRKEWINTEREERQPAKRKLRDTNPFAGMSRKKRRRKQLMDEFEKEKKVDEGLSKKLIKADRHPRIAKKAIRDGKPLNNKPARKKKSKAFEKDRK